VSYLQRDCFCLQQAWPYFLAFLAVENIVLWLERKPIIRPNDGVTSLSHGIIMECGRYVIFTQ